MKLGAYPRTRAVLHHAALLMLGTLLHLLPCNLALGHPHPTPVELARACTDAKASPAAPIDLNTADAAALVKLPGIGPARARAILQLRKRIGRFKRISQLLRVKGIGRATLRKLSPRVRITPRDSKP